MDLPVFITGTRPISGTCSKIYQTQVPVVCGGVVVNPGDIVFGDDDGIIVATEAQMEVRGRWVMPCVCVRARHSALAAGTARRRW